jgi:hypothetical protein
MYNINIEFKRNIHYKTEICTTQYLQFIINIYNNKSPYIYLIESTPIKLQIIII